MDENRCPEASKEGLEGGTQCKKQRWKYLQHVTKIISRSLEGLWVHSGMFGAFRREFQAKLGTRCAKLGPRWLQVESQMVYNGVKMGIFI